MEPDLEVVQIGQSESFKAWEHGYLFHTVRWHFHPEYELHHVVETSGRYDVGDYIEEFEPGHLVLTGPNLPHNWINNIPEGHHCRPWYGKRAIVSLVALYIAGICGIGYGLRQINEAKAANGAPVKRIMISGGAGQQDLVCQLLADTTGKPVVATASEEPVLLGSAILAGLAGGVFPDMTLAMTTMSSSTAAFGPASGRLAEHHAARFNAFQRLQNVAREVQKIA